MEKLGAPEFVRPPNLLAHARQAALPAQTVWFPRRGSAWSRRLASSNRSRRSCRANHKYSWLFEAGDPDRVPDDDVRGNTRCYNRPASWKLTKILPAKAHSRSAARIAAPQPEFFSQLAEVSYCLAQDTPIPRFDATLKANCRQRPA